MEQLEPCIVWKCAIPIGVVGSHACATLLSLVWEGADSPKTEHCLLTNWDACTGGKLLSRVLWVQVSLGAGGSERHVWGPQPYLMASLHARNFLFTEENFSGG